MLRRLLTVTILLYWAAMFVGTHVPRMPEAVDLSQVSDKTLHYSAYAVLGLLLATWWSLGWGWSWRQAGAVLLIIAGYGIADELLQIPVNRTADVEDWYADVIGASSGIALVSVLRLLLVRRGPPQSAASLLA